MWTRDVHCPHCGSKHTLKFNLDDRPDTRTRAVLCQHDDAPNGDMGCGQFFVAFWELEIRFGTAKIAERSCASTITHSEKRHGQPENFRAMNGLKNGRAASGSRQNRA